MQGDGVFFDFDIAGFDAGEVEDVGDKPLQGAATGLDHGDELALLGIERRLGEEFGKADDAVDGRAEFVADDGEELALGAVGGFGGVFGLDQRGLGLLALRDIVPDGLVFDDAVGVADRALNPQQPTTAVVGEDQFAFEGKGAVADGDTGRIKRKEFTVQLLAFFGESPGIRAVGEGDAPVGPVAADQVDLVLDHVAVVGLDLLEGAGHALDVAGETEDFVGIGFLAGGRRPLLGGRSGFAEGLEALHERAVPA